MESVLSSKSYVLNEYDSKLLSTIYVLKLIAMKRNVVSEGNRMKLSQNFPRVRDDTLPGLLEMIPATHDFLERRIIHYGAARSVTF